MEYRNRAERRRAEKQGQKASKPPVYNYTPNSLRNQLNWEAQEEVKEKLKKVKAEATADAINTTFMLMLTIPCNVLIDRFWSKEPEKVQEFIDLVIDQYDRWQNGELDMNVLKKDLWEIGGVRLEENVVGYKNQEAVDKVNAELKEIKEDLVLNRITAGDDMIAQSVGLSVVEKGNKSLIKKLEALGFKRDHRKKVVKRGTVGSSGSYSYMIVMSKDLREG